MTAWDFGLSGDTTPSKSSSSDAGVRDTESKEKVK